MGRVVAASAVGRRPGLGQFAGHVDPQDPTRSVATRFVASLMGDPGLRLSKQMGARGRRNYSGAWAPQRYAKPQGGTNTPESLAVVPIKSNRSRALGQFRGLPEMAAADYDT